MERKVLKQMFKGIATLALFISIISVFGSLNYSNAQRKNGEALENESGVTSANGNEVASTITVTTTADEYNATPNGTCSIREAIKSSNADVAYGGCTAGSGTDTVYIPAGTYTLTRTEGLGVSANDIDVNSNVTIKGAGKGTIIDANGLIGSFSIYADIATVSDLQLTGGYANSDNDWEFDDYGAGLYYEPNNPDSSMLTINNVSIYGNTAIRGAGLYVNAGNVTITNSTIYNNTTPASLISDGAGIRFDGKSLTIKNTTISGNTTNNNTGSTTVGAASALFFNGSNLTILNSTIANNSISQSKAKFAGGLGIKDTYLSTVSIKNTIFASNTAGGTSKNCATAFDGTGNISLSDGYNILSDNTCSGYFNKTGDKRNTDPQLGALAKNGGPTKTHALAANSPAIDAGTNTGCPSTDQRGTLRPFSNRCDIGAYEYTVAGAIPVYRFWSDKLQGHFYTISESEKQYVIDNYDDFTWKYEGIAFYAFAASNGTCASGQSPVYRFWSDQKQHHFYTISATEKQQVIDDYPDYVWKYERVAYCAFKTSGTNKDALYRFWSDEKQGHFYTTNVSERDYIINNYDDSVWKYEGIAYYTY